MLFGIADYNRITKGYFASSVLYVCQYDSMHAEKCDKKKNITLT